MSDFYRDLGLTTTLNAAATFTALGGSLMPEEVLDAMRSASGSFVDMHELHLAAGRKLAALTHNQAAYVTSGCAAAIVLGVLATRNAGDPGRIRDWPGSAEVPSEVIMHAAHRIPYDSAISLAGATIRQIGNTLQTFAWELESAIGPSTAAVFYVAGTHVPQGALPLHQVIQIAHERGIPVIVDAAAQLPPVENLWHFSADLGADLVVFSGGKALRGPQSSGLMVGTPALIEAARQNGAPFQRQARALKVGKEEIAGLIAAVERFVSLDHDAQRSRWGSIVDGWAEGLGGFTGVSVHPEDTNEAGQPVPRLHIRIADRQRAEAVLAHFESSTPRLAVLPDAPLGECKGLWITPDVDREENAPVILDLVRSALMATQ